MLLGLALIEALTRTDGLRHHHCIASVSCRTAADVSEASIKRIASRSQA